MIKESPDGIKKYDGISELWWNKYNSVAFGYFNDKFYISEPYDTHETLLWNKTGISDGRNRFKFPGRMWVEKKIFSLWKYPKTISGWKKLIEDLSLKTGQDIRKDFNVELAWGMKDNLRKNKKIVPVDELMNKLEGGNLSTMPQHSVDTQNIQHLKSPVQKQKQEVPAGVGSKKTIAGMPMAQYHTMRYPNENAISLKEDPDAILSPDGRSQYVHYLDIDARPFGYFNDKFYVADTNTIHPEWGRDFSSGNSNDVLWRKKMKFSGRIWLERKIFSLWEYPKTASEWKKLIKDLSSETDRDIRKDFSVELARAWGMRRNERKNNRIVPVSKLMDKIDAAGNKKLNIPQHSVDTQNLQHIKSPVQKQKQEVPAGIGSTKTVAGMTQAQRYQMFNQPENIISFKEIVEGIINGR